MGKRAVATLFFMVSFFHMASCLRCYSCSFEQQCSEPSSVETCKEGEQCGFIKGHSDYKVHESIFKVGCIPATKCSGNDNINHSNNPFRVTYSCCNTSYCNSGISVISHASRAHLFLLFVATLSAVVTTFLS